MSLSFTHWSCLMSASPESCTELPFTSIPCYIIPCGQHTTGSINPYCMSYDDYMVCDTGLTKESDKCVNRFVYSLDVFPLQK